VVIGDLFPEITSPDAAEIVVESAVPMFREVYSVVWLEGPLDDIKDCDVA